MEGLVALAHEGLPTFRFTNTQEQYEVEDEFLDFVVDFYGGLDKNDSIGSYPCVLSTQLANCL